MTFVMASLQRGKDSKPQQCPSPLQGVIQTLKLPQQCNSLQSGFENDSLCECMADMDVTHSILLAHN